MNSKDQDINEICTFLASRLRSERIRKGFTQEQMAALSEVPLRTYKRFEATGVGSTINLIKSLRSLERLRALEVLFPSPIPPRVSIIDRFENIAKLAKEKQKA